MMFSATFSRVKGVSTGMRVRIRVRVRVRARVSMGNLHSCVRLLWRVLE